MTIIKFGCKGMAPITYRLVFPDGSQEDWEAIVYPARGEQFDLSGHEHRYKVIDIVHVLRDGVPPVMEVYLAVV